MKAIKVTSENSVELVEVPTPKQASPGHVIIQMKASGINAGDNAFINGVFPKGSIPESQYALAGVSGVGKVTAVGEGVPEQYKNKNVMVYRSLKFSENIIGTWSEFTHMHYLQCAVVADNLNLEDYSGSLVNIVTPYAFLKLITAEGHQGIVCTAGNSATGIALLGICLRFNFPLISIVRDEAGKRALEDLGAKNILVQSDVDFRQQLSESAQALKATAIFDGVGGAILNIMVDVLAFGSTIYSYGYLGGQTPLTIHTRMLMKGLTIKGFNNFRSETVQNPEYLENALLDISSMLSMPHFKTKIGKKFTLAEVQDALQFSSPAGEKALLCF